MYLLIYKNWWKEGKVWIKKEVDLKINQLDNQKRKFQEDKKLILTPKDQNWLLKRKHVPQPKNENFTQLVKMHK